MKRPDGVSEQSEAAFFCHSSGGFDDFRRMQSPATEVEFTRRSPWVAIPGTSFEQNPFDTTLHSAIFRGDYGQTS